MEPAQIPISWITGNGPTTVFPRSLQIRARSLIITGLFGCRAASAAIILVLTLFLTEEWHGKACEDRASKGKIGSAAAGDGCGEHYVHGRGRACAPGQGAAGGIAH